MTMFEWLVRLIVNSALASHNRGKTMYSEFEAMRNGATPIMTSEATETPCSRTVNAIDNNLDQLNDTITSLEKVLNPGLRHALPEAQKTGAEAREAGHSPLHERLLDMQYRIQYYTRSIAELRNRVTL